MPVTLHNSPGKRAELVGGGLERRQTTDIHFRFSLREFNDKRLDRSLANGRVAEVEGEPGYGARGAVRSARAGRSSAARGCAGAGIANSSLFMGLEWLLRSGATYLTSVLRALLDAATTRSMTGGARSMTGVCAATGVYAA